MGLIYIADTNIISELMRKKPNKTLLSQWEQNHSQTAITSITWHELLFGVSQLQPSKRRDAFDRFLQTILESILILPYDQSAARWHARERTRLIRLGQTPSFADGQIAAITSTQEKILVTRNTKDFENFKELELENWFFI